MGMPKSLKLIILVYSTGNIIVGTGRDLSVLGIFDSKY